jgi:hypothetical protein
MLIKPWQILESDLAVNYLFTVSPVIVPLIGADEMRRFEAAFRRAAAGPESPSLPDDDAAEEAIDNGKDTAGDGEGELS